MNWHDVLNAIEDFPNPYDHFRQNLLKDIYEYTGRDTILYATAWMDPTNPPHLVSLTDIDIEGFIEITRNLKGDELDLVLHSPGGSPTVAEALVDYLREKYNHIRVIIPQAAMSAATMIATAADVIVMASHSSLGPIDPQFVIPTENGHQMVSAEAIQKQFEKAKKECEENPNAIAAWIPILRQYPPGLLIECEYATELAKELVQEWLEKYMFKGEQNAAEKARKIAKYLSSHEDTKVHDRHITRKKAQQLGLKIEYLENDSDFYDKIMTLYHTVTLTFDQTPVVKIFDNHLGESIVRVKRRG